MDKLKIEITLDLEADPSSLIPLREDVYAYLAELMADNNLDFSVTHVREDGPGVEL